jgi:hypothetical protein
MDIFCFTCFCHIIIFLQKSISPVSGSGYFGEWQWIKTNWSLGANGGKIIPSQDSTVILKLNFDNTYLSELNGQTTSQGNFQINAHKRTDTVFISTSQIFEIQTFTDTLFQFNNNLIKASSLILPSGLSISVSGDSLELYSPLTPGGTSFYFFVRK